MEFERADAGKKQAAMFIEHNCQSLSLNLVSLSALWQWKFAAFGGNGI
jgi:hypothetical protein